MKTLRGSLSFVLGMIVGIILFVLSIGGALVAVGMTVKVGKIQSSLTDVEIIDKDSDLYNSTLLDAALQLYDDIQNFDKLSLETIYDHFGIKYVKEFGGIDFSSKDFYKLTLGDIMNDISQVTNSFTLDDIGDLAGVNFDDYNIPMLTDNTNLGISDFIDKILASFNGSLSIRFIKDNFIPDFDTEGSGFLDALQDINFDSFGSVINNVPLRTVLDLSVDSYVKAGINQVYVKTDRYEAISSTDLKNASYTPAFGVKTYIAGADDSDNLIERELRYEKITNEDGTVKYKVNNESYIDSFDADTNTTQFYRYIEYEPYAGTAPDGSYYVIAYGNNIKKFSGTTYSLTPIGFINLNSIYSDGAGHPALNTMVVSGKVTVANCYYKDETNTEKSSSYYLVTDSPITADSTLVEDAAKSHGAVDYYVLAAEGTAAEAMKLIAYKSLNTLGDTSFVENMKIGDIIEIDSDSSVIMQSLKDKKVGELSTVADDLTIDQVIKVDSSSSLVLQSLAAKGTTISQMSTVMDTLKIDEVIKIDETSPKLLQTLKSKGTIIKDLGTVMDTLKISEIIDIYANYGVELSENASATGFIVSKYADEKVDGTNITYIVDDNGKYIASPVKYVEATSAKLGESHSSHYQYGQITSYTDALSYVSQGNIYVYNNDKYTYNTVLTSYLVAQSYNADPATANANIIAKKLYFRADAGSGTAYTYYDGTGLYVEIAGIKVAYDKSNPAHADLTKYYLLTSNEYEYFVPIDEYKDVYVKNTGSAYTIGTSSDTALYTNTTVKFSRQFCETIYVKASDGGYVYDGSDYVAYDAAKHEGLDRFTTTIGYYATKAQSYSYASYFADANITLTGVKVLNEKSAKVLQTMAKNNSTINGLSSVLSTATIEELMEVTPDSIFNNASIKASTINGLSDSIKTVFNTMTIGGLCDWANISEIDANVKSALNDVTMIKFFKSLRFDQEKGIYVDMMALFLS